MEWVKSHVDTLVFGGGGIRGLSYLGALEELEKVWDFRNLKQVCGASVGSIYALLLACRIPLPQMKNILLSPLWNTVYQQINIGALSQTFGLVDARKSLLPVIEMFLETPNETFAELKTRTGISLTVAVTCFETGQIEYHNDLLTPLLSIGPSIAASCAIPFIFAPIAIQNRLYIDGATLISFPLPKHVDWKTALIFKCEMQPSMNKDSNPSFLNYVTDVVLLVLNFAEREALSKLPALFHSHVLNFENLKNIKSWDFHLEPAQRLELYEYGRTVMCKFLNAPEIVVGKLMASYCRINLCS
jgi:predicted acylesterase/phospholipase RssA